MAAVLSWMSCSCRTRRSSDLGHDDGVEYEHPQAQRFHHLVTHRARAGNLPFLTALMLRVLMQQSKRSRNHRRKYQGRKARSEEHTSELEPRRHLVCRLLLVKH